MNMEKSGSFLLSIKETLESKVAKIIMFILLFSSTSLLLVDRLKMFGIELGVSCIFICLSIFFISGGYFIYISFYFVYNKINNAIQNYRAIYYIKHLMTVDEAQLLYERFYNKTANVFKRNGWTGDSGLQEESLALHRIMYLSGKNDIGEAAFNLYDNVLTFLNRCVKTGKIVFIDTVNDTMHYTHEYNFIIIGYKQKNQSDISVYNNKKFVLSNPNGDINKIFNKKFQRGHL